MKFFALALTVASVFNLPVCFAQSQKWDLDKSHSTVNFGVDHMVVSETKGKFNDFSADVLADRPDFTDAKFTVVIQTASIDTSDAKRDEHLKNKDFFNVTEKGKETITVEGKKFEKLKNGKYKVHAKLTLNGVSKDVVWDAKYNGTVKDPYGNTRAGLKVWGAIDRNDFGLKYNSVLDNGGLAIGKEVRVEGNFEFTKKPAA